MKPIIFAIMMCTVMTGVLTAGEKGLDVTTFTAKGISTVDVRTSQGLIFIEGAKGSDIRVEQLPDNARVCDVTMAVADGRLILKAIEKDGEYKKIKTGFRVQLPKGISIVANTVSGDIRIADIFAPVEARSTSGEISLGGIAASLIKAGTISGNIKLKNISGSLEAESVSGNIKGAITATAAAQSVTLSNTSGNISVTFPKNAQMNVSAVTTSGEIHNDFSGKTGIPVIAKTISGDITIGKARK